MESDRQRFDRIAKIYAQRLAGEEPSEEEWEDIFFVAPFGIWQAEQEQRPAKFATLAYYSAAAPHSRKSTADGGRPAMLARFRAMSPSRNA